MRRLALAPKPPNTLVVYRGPSAYDGAPIVAILSGLAKPSRNTKTGPMAQLWILPQHEPPHVAQRTGGDASVCGTCPLRPIAGGEVRCYVTTVHGPRATWNANKDKPVALEAAAERLQGMALRLGAYGDPAALPEHVVATLCAKARTHTGYTHGWRKAPWLRRYTMASVESELDMWQALAAGFRTFRIGSAPLARIEVECPHTTHGVQCADCGLCEGGKGARSITIAAH